jgi:hypothetical protein
MQSVGSSHQWLDQALMRTCWLVATFVLGGFIITIEDKKPDGRHRTERNDLWTIVVLGS